MDIPGYSIRGILGHGGMGTVYLALQESLDREIALKVLLPSLARDPIATERFLREARYAAKLHHPNIAAIHEVGTHADMPYMAMSYEPGGTLAQALHGPLEPGRALGVVRDIGSALEHAHRRGVVHRDVKPENILLRGDGTCVLSDFGIAHALAQPSGLTTEGTSVGTPHYMSPEQLRGETVDGRSDLYSLGIVLHQMLTGELPYTGADGWAIGVQHINAGLPQLPSALARYQSLLNDLLAKSPANRIQDGGELVRRVDALRGPGVPTISSTQFQASAGAPRRGPWPGLAAAAVLAVVLAAWFAWHGLSGDGKQDGKVARAVAVAAATPAAAATGVAPSGSIAVLPLADDSEKHDLRYLTDGLAEEIINELSRTPGLLVVGRTSSFRFRDSGEDPKSIGRDLGVENLLEGSLRRTAAGLHITMRLTNAASGFQVWAQNYDRQPDDAFALQSEIAAAVAHIVHPVAPMAAAPSVRAPRPEAYTQLLRARQFHMSESIAENQQAVDAFRKAVALDPAYAPAHAGLAYALFAQSDDSDNAATHAELQRESLAEANRAIALDPSFAGAYSTRGMQRFTSSWDWDGAREDLGRALSISPGTSSFLTLNARLLTALGQFDAAGILVRKATASDPLNPWSWLQSGHLAMVNSQWAQARIAIDRALAVRPGLIDARFQRGELELLQGHRDAAREQFDRISFKPYQLLGKVLVQPPGQAADPALADLIQNYSFIAAYQIAVAYAWRNENDRAFEWLDRAFVQHDGGLVDIKSEPLLRGLHDDPRYGRLLARMGLPR